MSGAIILVVVSAYDYVAGCAVAEEIRRRKLQTCVDASPGSPFAARLAHYGLSSAGSDVQLDGAVPAAIAPQTFAHLPDLLDDLEAFHAWLLDGQGRHLPPASALSGLEQAQVSEQTQERTTVAAQSSLGILDRLSRLDVGEDIQRRSHANWLR